MMNEKDIERLEDESGVKGGQLQPALIVLACLIIGAALIAIRLLVVYL